jgi:gamma-glutamyltranspeptidase/glutathione hydrolase
MKLQDIVFPEKLKIIFYLAVTSIIFFTWPAHGDEAPIIDYRDRFHPVASKGGMVVSQERLASQVGAGILAAGGNAIDAAVATGFALAVTLPQAGNLGGGGFMLIYLAEEDSTLAVDYREMAPAAAKGDLFLDEQGKVDQNKARFR